MIKIPIPSPRKNEKQKDFFARCMSNKIMKKEYEDTNQRYAVCMSSWRNSKKKAEGDKIVSSLVSTWTVVGIEKNLYDDDITPREYCVLRADNNRITLNYIPSFVTEIGQRIKVSIEDASIKLGG